MERVASIILCGGEGQRLSPLTQTCAKPALPFGGRYALVDIPMSCSLNSNIQKIFVVTQFLSSSIHQHLAHIYRFNSSPHAFLRLLSAEQKPSGKTWFQGTADAVRQNLHYLQETPVDYFLILSGDQLYNMRFEEFIECARESGADLTIGATPVTLADTRRVGIMRVDSQGHVTDFLEKPKDPQTAEPFAFDDAIRKKYHLSSPQDKKYLASMGIYVFKRQALFDILAEDPREDFGKHLIGTMTAKGKVSAWVYDGYWEDVGTVGCFHRANMALTKPGADFDGSSDSNPIYTCPRHLPGPLVIKSSVDRSIVCEGCRVDGAELSESILGPRSVVNRGSIIRRSYVMGNDYYTWPLSNNEFPKTPSIGEECLIENSILDKNVCLGNRVQLVNKKGIDQLDADPLFIRDGIIVIKRNAIIPDGFTL